MKKTLRVSIFATAITVCLQLLSCNGSSNSQYSETDESETSSNFSQPSNSSAKKSTKKKVVINSELDFRNYINNKTFKSTSDHLSFTFRNSENTWYGGANPFGTMQVTGKYSDGIFFNIISPYNHKAFKFAFEFSTSMLYDDEGREYVMK